VRSFGITVKTVVGDLLQLFDIDILSRSYPQSQVRTCFSLDDLGKFKLDFEDNLWPACPSVNHQLS